MYIRQMVRESERLVSERLKAFFSTYVHQKAFEFLNSVNPVERPQFRGRVHVLHMPHPRFMVSAQHLGNLLHLRIDGTYLDGHGPMT